MVNRFLRSINALPIRLTVRHVEAFGPQTAALKDGVLDSPEAWDALRRAHPHFSIAPNREEWLRVTEGAAKKDGQDGGLRQRAADVGAVLERNGITAVFSVGVGGAGLEYHLKKMRPALRVICSEYAPENVDMLKAVFTEADGIVRFDMKDADWSPAAGENTLALLYRVDPHATDAEWRDIFRRMHAAGVRNVLFIPCGFLTLKSLVQRRWRAFRLRRSGQAVVFSGFLRTRKTFESFWQGLYDGAPSVFGGYTGYYLQRQPEVVR